MDKEFANYKQSVAVKDLGFDEPCLARYCVVTEWEKPTGEIRLQNIDCNLSEMFLVKAPLKQQVFRWFRENYGMQAYITNYLEMCGNNDDTYHVVVHGSWWPHLDRKDYDEAENEAIDKLIELAKQQDK